MSTFSFSMLDSWALHQEPVFILGPERSGTSMMFRTIVSHPSFCSFDQATVETFAFIRPFSLLQEASPDNYELRVYLGKQYPLFVAAMSELQAINKICDANGIGQMYLEPEGFRAEVWEQRRYRDLLRLFFYFSWLNLGERRLAEKTPAHVRCLRQVFEVFPRAKVLVCLRDPIEIIASHRKRLEKEISLGKQVEDPGLGWLTKSIPQHLQYFQAIEKKIVRAELDYPGQLKRVSYARVTAEPAFLAEVFGFLGEDIDQLQNQAVSANDASLQWDPLLNSLPVNNQIDISRYLSVDDVSSVKEMIPGRDLSSWV